MASNRTTQADMLRKVYLDRMEMSFNLDSIISQTFHRNREEYAEGEELSLTTHTGVTGAITYNTTGDLPEAGFQPVRRHAYNYVHQLGTFEIAVAHMEGARKKYAAERRPYDFETRNLIKQLRHAQNFMYFGDGSGTLTAMTSASDSTTVVVDSVRGLIKGMRVDIILTSTGGTGGGVSKATINGIVRGTKTVTLGKAMSDFNDVNSNPTNYTMYLSGSRNNTINGLTAICDDGNPAVGNLGGVDRTASGNEDWQGNVFEADNPRKVSFQLIDEVVNQVNQVSDGKIDIAFCGYNVHSQLISNHLNLRRFNAEQKVFNGWAHGIHYNGEFNIIRDKHCPEDEMFLLDSSKFTIYENGPGKWMDDDGGLLARVPGKLAYNAAWYRFCQVVCHAPNTTGWLKDLDTQVATS